MKMLLLLMSLLCAFVSNSVCALGDDDIELGNLEFYLHRLYHKNKKESFRQAVLDGRNVDQLNELGQSVLHLAAKDGNIEWINLLLSLHANIELPDQRRQWTPYVWALVAGRYYTCIWLKKRGAKIIRLYCDMFWADC